MKISFQKEVDESVGERIWGTVAITVAISMLVIAALTGCKGTLAPGGAYNSGSTNTVIVKADYSFFVIDSAYRLAYSTIDAAFKFERDNRLLLWGKTKEIKKALDKIRPQAVDINRQYLLARAAYIRNPTPAKLTILNALMLEIQNLSNAVMAALPQQ